MSNQEGRQETVTETNALDTGVDEAEAIETSASAGDKAEEE